MPLVWGVQVEPLNFKMVPFQPTAQMLLASLPHRPGRYWVVPLLWGVQVVPFHFTILSRTFLLFV